MPASGPATCAQCQGDPALLADVESLLAADAEASEFLRTSSSTAATIVSQSRESPGQMIGRYKLLQLLARVASAACGCVREPLAPRLTFTYIRRARGSAL
jgi:hypothetical protein